MKTKLIVIQWGIIKWFRFETVHNNCDFFWSFLFLSKCTRFLFDFYSNLKQFFQLNLSRNNPFLNGNAECYLTKYLLGRWWFYCRYFLILPVAGHFHFSFWVWLHYIVFLQKTLANSAFRHQFESTLCQFLKNFQANLMVFLLIRLKTPLILSVVYFNQRSNS